ncbi:hypothetical protein [Planctomicrobium piriforme]|nr:hypothetical protein [Planctomicrobium piriforme]
MFGVVLALRCLAMPVQAEESPLPSLKLQYRAPNQSLLFVVGEGAAEVAPMREACDQNKLRFESSPSYDIGKPDFSGYHAIVGGSNNLDYFGWGESDESKKSRIFSNLKQFVADGGHLFLFATYHGRNSERFKEFGIVPGDVEATLFEHIPGRSEVLFHGSENLVPPDGKVRSWGNLGTDPARGPVDMLKRVHPEGWSQQPVLTTVCYGNGRVSYCTVEPSRDGVWMIPIAVNWIARGAPTNKDQIGTDVVVDRARLKQWNSSVSLPVPPPDLNLTEDAIRSEAASHIWKQMSKDADPKRHFIALKTAWEIAASSGDFALADQILKEASGEYQVDKFRIRRAMLDVRMVRRPGPDAALAKFAFAWSEEAYSAGRFLDAQRFAEQAKQLAATDLELLARIEKRQIEFEPSVSAEKAVRPLMDQPNDSKRSPQQNEVLGRFYAFTSRQWDQGLSYLQDGEDEALRELARLDLADPADPLQQSKLADRWRTYGGPTTPQERLAIEQRSRYWFDVSIPKLQGQDRIAAEESLRQLRTPSEEIRFKLKLEGRGRLEIDSERMNWVQYYGQAPTEILVNSRPWKLSESPSLHNQDVSRFASQQAEFRDPGLNRIHGRSMVVLQRSRPGKVIIDLADIPVGADDYEFILTIGASGKSQP